ncbi:MAG: AMP-binding protein, partial [Deltaproteobacteria bacterium]|nr:AMP-binding protein [Deltaproteobacteria bacterium]
YEMARTEGHEMAAILFTSGGTGTPKGAIYTHTNFAAQVEIIRKTYNILPGEIDLATFPLFALFDPALGMTTVVPDMDPTRPAHVDPEKIIEVVKDFDITNMFGSPALINRVGRYGAGHGVKLLSLRRVIAAGAPMPPAVLERFCTMLSSDTQVFTGFGATEAMPVCSIGSHEILSETRHGTDEGRGVCIGRPVEDVTVSVIGALNLATGEIGEITVKGPIVTSAYYKKEEATRLAKIHEPDGKGLWHRMGDLGFFDEKGRLWFCGRKSQRVITESGTFYTIPCEGVFNTHPDVYRTALAGVNMHGSIQPVLCVELEEDSKGVDKERVRLELLELGATKPHTKEIRTILFHDSFPVDIRHNAKIFRDKLAVWAEKKLT